MSKRLSELRIVDLKLELKKLGLKQTGKKPELINRLKGSLNSSYLSSGDSVNKQQVNNHLNKQITINEKPSFRKNKNVLNFVSKIQYLQARVRFLEVTLTKLRKKKLNKTVRSVSNKRTSSNLVDNALEHDSSGLKSNTGSLKTLPEISYQNNNPKVCSPRIFVIGDNSAEHCVSLLNNILNGNKNNKYFVSSIIKPYALYDDVVKDLKNLCSDFGPDDHIVVFAGIMNVLKGKNINKSSLNSILSSLFNTNVTLIGTTFCSNRDVLNNLMHDLNMDLFTVASNFRHVKYLDANKYLGQEQIVNRFTFITPYIKRYVLNFFYTFYINNDYINYNNLIEVCTVNSRCHGPEDLSVLNVLDRKVDTLSENQEGDSTFKSSSNSRDKLKRDNLNENHRNELFRHK